MELVISTVGVITTIYDEAIDLGAIGSPVEVRHSIVELPRGFRHRRVAVKRRVE